MRASSQRQNLPSSEINWCYLTIEQTPDQSIIRRAFLDSRYDLTALGYVPEVHVQELTQDLGARDVISMITARRVVKKLILGHNTLGDEGCIVLFTFLRSAAGRKYTIEDISINSNNIGNRGLSAITEYLRGNHNLKELFLQNNEFTGDGLVIKSFVDALNSSHLEVLSLATNRHLSDSFTEAFFPHLDSRHLRELHLSVIGLSPHSSPHILDYISSHRCQLQTLKSNGNTLGFRAVKNIIQALERDNYSLLIVELYSNRLSYDSVVISSEDDDFSPDTWKTSEALLKRVLTRNGHLKRETECQALRLLRYARPLLLHSKPDPVHNPSSAHAPCSSSCSCFPSLENVPSPSVLPAGTVSPRFVTLPTEIQHHILSFFAPILSPAQRIRVYHYASTPSTLPPLLPCLPSLGSRTAPKGNTVCVPDPSSLGFGDGGKVWSIGGGGVGVGGGCAAGKCMGSGNSVMCHREEDRVKWLMAVGCSAYEPERPTQNSLEA